MLRSVRSYRTPGGDYYTLYAKLAERPHLLIAGATGSGKSVTVNGIIYTLLLSRSPFQCQFVLVDPKRVELVQYSSLPHVARYASEPDDIIRSLQWAVDEMENRFRSMQADRVREYASSDLYVIIDELADLMTTQKDSALPLLQRIAQMGRAAHVHLIACSQCVLAKIIPTELKCNLSTVLGLRTATKAQSRFLVAVPGCESLPDPAVEGKGYAFLRDGANIEKKYIHRYTDEQIDQIVNYWTSSACVAV